MDVNKNTCRLCLLDDGVVKIFENTKSTISEMIKRCCQFEIVEEDNFPQKLCHECLNTLKTCYAFILQCEQNNKLLKLRNNNTAIEPKYFIKCEIDEDLLVKPENEDFDDDVVEPSIDSTIDIKKNSTSKKLSNTLECDVCGKSIMARNFKHHKETHESGWKYDCGHCSKKFKVRETFRRHVKKAHKGTLVECVYCKKVFSYQEKLEGDCTEKKHICDVCYHKFNDFQLKQNKNNHEIESCHTILFNDEKNQIDDDVTEEIKIESVVKTFTSCKKSKKNTKIHSQVPPSRTKMCDICGKFVSKSSINVHKERHSSEKKYCCDICNKRFIVRDELQKHIKHIHGDDCNVTCEFCKKVYKNHLSLLDHIAYMHKPAKYHTCNICNHKFNRARSLRGHMKVHTQEKPYKCRFCDSTFALRSTKQDHERLHMGITPYECPLCQKAFTQLCNLKSHFKYNHKESIFKEVYQSRKREVQVIDDSIIIPKISVIGSRGRKILKENVKLVSSC